MVWSRPLPFKITTKTSIKLVSMLTGVWAEKFRAQDRSFNAGANLLDLSTLFHVISPITDLSPVSV